MSRMERVKQALAQTIAAHRSMIERSHAEGKLPQDYSLGFVNGLIFVDHHLNMREGNPVFLDRTTSIGTLPKPVVLHSGNALKDEQIYQFMQDEVLLAARNVCEYTDDGIESLRAAIKKMDAFVEDQLQSQEEAKAQAEALRDAESQSQAGSTPAASSISQEEEHA